MDTIFALLVFFAFIMLIISLIKPSLGLFFLKEDRTRKKASLIYGLTLVLSFILFTVSSPEISEMNKSTNFDEANVAGSEINETNDSYLTNKSLNKWINKSNKESYIEDLIDGVWIAEYSMLGVDNFEPKLKEYNKEVTKPGEATFIYGFERGTFPKFNHTYMNFKTVSNPDEIYKQAGAYSVNDEKLTLIIQNGISDVDKVENEVLFISKSALIIKDDSSIKVFSKKEKQENASEDIEDFLTFFKKISLEKITKITENYRFDILASENSLSSELSNLKRFNLIRNDMYPTNLKNMIDNFRKQYSSISDSLLAAQFHTSLNKEEYMPKSKKLPVVENYILKFEELQPIILNSIASRESSNFEIENLQKVYSKEFSKYKNMYREYSLYGSGDKYSMKYAAISAIKSGMNDPKSFDFVDGYPTEKITKSGWVYYIKYRGKNAFGGTVVEERNVTLKYSTENRAYKAVKVK